MQSGRWGAATEVPGSRALNVGGEHLGQLGVLRLARQLRGALTCTSNLLVVTCDTAVVASAVPIRMFWGPNRLENKHHVVARNRRSAA